jgi:hypothetical protein
MSFADVLVESAVPPIAAEQDLEQLHPIAYSSQHEWTAKQYHEVVSRSYPLTVPYRYLAWSAVGAVYDAARSTGTTELSARTMHLADASAAGIFGMVRYLSNLPFIYHANRFQHENMPKSIQGRVAELGSIARRDNGYLAAVAGQSIQVSSRIERDDYLRGELPGNSLARLEDMQHRFLLEEASDGLRVNTRFSLEDRIERIKNWFHYEHPDDRNLGRAAGCLALHVKDSEGVAVFDKIWASFVYVALDDARFFEADLSSLDEQHREWEVAI